MNAPLPLAFGPRHLRRTTGLLVTLWTLAVAASAVWSVHLLHDAMLEAAATAAQSDFNKDLLYRKWATLQGGVYVPVTPTTPPNPYLTNVVERDLVTPSGRRLTLVNPAYMARQVHALETEEFGTHGHLTSLKPLRPENAPDAWEAAALRAFEQGRTEVSSRELVDGEPHLRLMKPLVTEAACLKCHAGQGYKVGDIHGGLSIAVPLAPYQALAQARIAHIAVAHAGLWILGGLGILLGARQMRQRLNLQLRAEDQLRQSEVKFRTVADWTYDMETWRGPEGRFLYVSPSAERITGYRAEEFLADPELTLKITHPDDRARVAEHDRKISQPGNDVCSLDFRILTRSGEERWISHFCQPVYGADGRWLGQRSGNRDVTARKQTEEALRRSETKFRTLYDSTSDAVMLLDEKGFFDCNPATLTMFGCATREEFCAKHPAEVSPPAQPDGTDSRTLANQRIATAIEKGHHRFEWLHQRADTGAPFPAEVLLSAMELDGKPVLQAVVRDITERRQAEEKLREMSRAVEQSPASIVITDSAGNIEYANPKFIEITGYTLAEVLGQNPRVLKSGEKSPEAYRDLWQTITAGKEWRGEFHNKKKNGELYWESASISPIRDPAGRVTHFVAVKEDITERKAAEADRERLIQDLQAALANVKSLSGLLPICAGCKKIRDDQGYWSQVESYISQHTDARFSHGLCPDCIKIYFPDAEEDGSGNSPKEAS